MESLEEVRGEALASPRLTTTLLVMFALLALCITAAGLAGVVAFSVSQRTQEIGVRMALGAERGEVLSMVLREGMRLVVAGLVLGVAGAMRPPGSCPAFSTVWRPPILSLSSQCPPSSSS